jgi:hypothetical protein
MKRFAAVLPVLLFIMANCHRPAVRAGASLTGAWKVAEIRTAVSGGVRVNGDPQPGLVIFTDRYYSIGQVPGVEPRKPSKKTWFPTDLEKVHDFDAVIFNSGWYERTDSVLIVHPMVAKTPEFMGGEAVYAVRAARDTLWLTGTDILSFDGVRDPYVEKARTTMKLVRAE